MASEDLEQSLRAEFENYINERLTPVQEEIARLQSQFNEAFTRLLERTAGESEIPADASVSVAIADHLRSAHNAGIEQAAAESSRAQESSDMALLKAAVDDLNEQRSQVDILNTLVNRAAAFAPRVAFFVVKNDRATGWRARGLEGTVGDDAVREISLALDSNTVLSEVAKRRQAWSGTPGTHADDHLIYSRFSEEPPQSIVAIPLIARDKTVAVLYADCADMDAGAIKLEALETVVRVAGMAVELLATRRGAPAEARPAPEPVRASTPPAPSPERTAPAAPATSRTSSFAPEAAPVATQPTPPAPTPAPAPTPLQPEIVATPVVEAQPEIPAQPAPAASAPLGAARRYGSADMELPVEVREEERRYHNDARRFARLLVSEIKLYNEQKVREGRSANDLYDRLREDIDRSRQMYDKRIAPEVAGRYDYFHHELVNTLAEGDARKLGENYPGATVAA